MVTHFDFGYDDAINRVKEGLENMKTSLRYMGSCDWLQSPELYSAGDVVYNNSDGLTYVCVGADSWEPLSYTADLYQPKVPKIQRKVKSHCPHCGGPITCISSDAEYKGYQKCEWCMSVINIYEDEDSEVNSKLRILNAD